MAITLHPSRFRYGTPPENIPAPEGYEYVRPDFDSFITVKRKSDGAEFFAEYEGNRMFRITRKRYAEDEDVLRSEESGYPPFKKGEAFYDQREQITL